LSVPSWRSPHAASETRRVADSTKAVAAVEDFMALSNAVAVMRYRPGSGKRK
jgi:hypothetical protein